MKEYPGILDRVKAALMDGVIMIILMVLAKQIFQIFDDVPNLMRALAFISIWVIYEPLSVSLTGKTLGHAANGICVKKDQDSKQKLKFY
ncbi:RDD family protein [Ekhidna sp.]|uniref:RDD family protein n=1 Tax=Ekhidna sp. TaxID=2608089 RepID=UPI0032981E2C